MSDEPQHRKLIVVGGGELARVVIETARQAGWNVRGFVDPEPCEETATRLNVQRLGDDLFLRSLTDERLVLGIGNVRVSPVRELIVAKVGSPERWTAIIHPFTSISPTARIAPGAIVLAGAVICSGAVISEHAIINLGATVDHDTHVGKFVHVAPRAAIGGGSRVEDNSYIGMGAVVRDHVAVSPGTLVGMGAVVTTQFAAGSTLVGVPAKPMS